MRERRTDEADWSGTDGPCANAFVNTTGRNIRRTPVVFTPGADLNPPPPPPRVRPAKAPALRLGLFLFAGGQGIAPAAISVGMLARRVRTDGFIDPCIPTLAAKPPVGSDWVHEIKHDGYRLIVRRDGKALRLFYAPRPRLDRALSGDRRGCRQAAREIFHPGRRGCCLRRRRRGRVRSAAPPAGCA